jgi:hypothetical protein
VWHQLWTDILETGVQFHGKQKDIFFCSKASIRQSQWPRCLRRRSTAVRLLRLGVRIPPAAWMFVCCECCLWPGRFPCVALITSPEESYRLWCVVVCDIETLWMRRPWPTDAFMPNKLIVHTCNGDERAWYTVPNSETFYRLRQMSAWILPPTLCAAQSDLPFLRYSYGISLVCCYWLLTWRHSEMPRCALFPSTLINTIQFLHISESQLTQLAVLPSCPAGAIQTGNADTHNDNSTRHLADVNVQVQIVAKWDRAFHERVQICKAYRSHDAPIL